MVKNDDYCMIHFNQIILCRSKKSMFCRILGLLSLNLFDVPMPFGMAKLQKNDDFCCFNERVLFKKVIRKVEIWDKIDSKE